MSSKEKCLSKYHILSHGCQMNERDAETIGGLLNNLNYQHTNTINDADIIIIHTCCVRESAENKIFGKVGELKHLKKNKPNLIIAVCGCMVQQKDTAAKLISKAPHIDIVFGTHNLHQLPQLIEQHLLVGQSIIEVWDEAQEIVENLPAKRDGKYKAYVNIAYGCDNYCTYCIVPYVRGRERSRLPKDIISEIELLANDGYKEIILLGQNVNSYGKDLDLNIDFSDLLKMVDQVPEIWRIRFMTSHPKDFTEKVALTVKDSQKICPHIHLPVQAGSNRILEKMNRNYTKEQYLKLIDIIKKEMPHGSITTDIIVGFPGETEENFSDTLEVVKKSRFDASYTFLYSKRSGTPAATMDEQIDAEIKKKRLQSLMDLQNKISLELNQELVGNIVEVLVEGPSKTNQQLLTGRTKTNKVVVFPGDEKLIGKLCHVEINEAKTWNLVGIYKGKENL